MLIALQFTAAVAGELANDGLRNGLQEQDGRRQTPQTMNPQIPYPGAVAGGVERRRHAMALDTALPQVSAQQPASPAAKRRQRCFFHSSIAAFNSRYGNFLERLT